VVLTVVNLDPRATQQGNVRWDRSALRLSTDAFTVLDEVTGEKFDWRDQAHVTLDPRRAVAHIATVVAL
jgi:starch synthase (maltosyl-transferring)